MNKRCKVQCLQMLAQVGCEYQVSLLCICAFLTYHQFCVTMVHCGMDFTFGLEAGHDLYIMGAEAVHNLSVHTLPAI